ncbi:hypothetical protein H8M03_06910 [Sphingomonas sabuli]|uniref:Uncharacterized protein n=1 Tax=Sphingomonas sabuli TaxID=2764186 RepID=A0A7G9KZJ6_9SPHN|nr:hypothetical protein [Sphingomonas sabuli]QNM81795.1 hypothetical protein H8M03_06910 [Sphingomonas sabuli]
MSAPLRFLFLLAAGWTGVRMVSAGVVPGFTAGDVEPASARSTLAAIEPTQFAPLPPVESPAPYSAAYADGPAYPPQWRAAYPPPLPYHYAAYPAASVSPPIPPRRPWSLPPQGTPAADPVFF